MRVWKRPFCTKNNPLAVTNCGSKRRKICKESRITIRFCAECSCKKVTKSGEGHPHFTRECIWITFCVRTHNNHVAVTFWMYQHGWKWSCWIMHTRERRLFQRNGYERWKRTSFFWRENLYFGFICRIDEEGPTDNYVESRLHESLVKWQIPQTVPAGKACRVRAKKWQNPKMKMW